MALRNLVSQLELSEGDRKTLLAASTVLNLNGEKCASVAKNAKRSKEVEEKAIARAHVVASELLKTWAVVSILDKVALCAVKQFDLNLRHDQLYESRHWKKSLDYWIEEALREIPNDAALKAVRQGKSVEEVMSATQNMFTVAKAHPSVIALAEHWQALEEIISEEHPAETTSTTV